MIKFLLCSCDDLGIRINMIDGILFLVSKPSLMQPNIPVSRGFERKSAELMSPLEIFYNESFPETLPIFDYA